MRIAWSQVDRPGPEGPQEDQEDFGSALAASLERLEPPGPWTLAGVAAAAVATDLAVRSGVAGVAGALLVAVAAAALLAGARPANRQAWLLAACAPLFGAWLAIRTSGWLLPLDVLAAAGLLGLAASFARGGSVLDLGLAGASARALHGMVHVMAAPGLAGSMLARALPARRPAGGEGGDGGGDGRGGRHPALSVLTGLALAAPVIAVLWALLASADVVFASLLDPASAVGHLVLLTLGAYALLGLVRVALVRPVPPVVVAARWLGGVETVVVLAAIDVLFVTFAAAQVVALGEGGRRVIRTAGLTYAGYARSGFFQLLAVAVLTLALLLALRAWTRGAPPRLARWLLVLSELAVVLTLALVAVSLRRMGLYVQAYGLTMLRLFVAVFTVWVALVFVLLGAALAGAWPRRAWLGPAAGAAGLALLLALNVVNPEALVHRHDVERAAAGATGAGGLDPDYLAELSDDAVPTALALLPRTTSAEERAAVLAAACDRPAPRHRGWAAANLARARAEAARRERCPGG
ncbi:MAG TPA: DUF4173 domain-containing protein [Actinomycetes bacterium]|nr:DUF4173 domain-containing protein [Actinomycetes bacterium]